MSRVTQLVDKYGKLGGLNLLVIIYLVFATVKYIERRHDGSEECPFILCSPFGMLVFVSGATYLGLFYFKLFKPFAKQSIKEKIFEPIKNLLRKFRWWKLALTSILIIGFVSYVVYETHQDFKRLRALIGISSIILICFIFSVNRRKINWRPVVSGGIFQFLIGVFCIQWKVGRTIFECFGEKVTSFLNYAKGGSTFVFGNFLVFEERAFAFSVLPSIIFFSLTFSMLSYLGVLDWILFKLGSLIQSILGTTVCESVNAALNIFVGMTKGPLMFKDYISVLTESEIHAIIVSGLGSISGNLLGAYVAFGAEAKHLITASVMAAPTSLFLSKLIHPETEESQTSSGNIKTTKSTDSSLLDAASNGAALGIQVILGIIACLVAFVAFFSFADGILQWITSLVGFEEVGIQFILGKVFIPVSWAIGVDWRDCELVGNVIGTKTIVNEFVAYQMLGEYKKAGLISLRSSAIATFAISGFANPASLATIVGILRSLAPERGPSISKVALRGFVTGCLVSLMTASVASLLITDDIV